ncbi:hypothetical protein AVT69_gp342 [Pseudomonas phage PhiPA3]|uniref:Uncharacterized protein 344 n=1 Tax=Pseudomonas phage PhiPA3 TaxID=998086 RepID=F8SJH9_BPPA3|nr:hypothetical protein AVT69_gp342 [Pseudomonas phage PhiPA3]AEH03767.1 hypothetical protein [Pseudomonas phage PhiPA3]
MQNEITDPSVIIFTGWDEQQVALEYIHAQRLQDLLEIILMGKDDNDNTYFVIRPTKVALREPAGSWVKHLTALVYRIRSRQQNHSSVRVYAYKVPLDTIYSFVTVGGSLYTFTDAERAECRSLEPKSWYLPIDGYPKILKLQICGNPIAVRSAYKYLRNEMRTRTYIGVRDIKKAMALMMASGGDKAYLLAITENGVVVKIDQTKMSIMESKNESNWLMMDLIANHFTQRDCTKVAENPERLWDEWDQLRKDYIRAMRNIAEHKVPNLNVSVNNY